MKKKEREVATNLSSGAEKVEVIEKEKKIAKNRQVNSTVKATKSAKGDAALGDSVNREKTKPHSREERESEAAKERVAEALQTGRKKGRKLSKLSAFFIQYLILFVNQQYSIFYYH